VAPTVPETESAAVNELSENAETNQWVRGIAAEACAALFSDYGVLLHRTEEYPKDAQQVLYCGVMGFVGRALRGSCLLAASESALMRSRPLEGPVRDWTGELTNQLVGRLKLRLLTRGVDVAMTTPIVLRGEHLAPLPRRRLQPITFEANPGAVVLWVELEAAPDFKLMPESEARRTVAEGELVLF
jgi:hypothetical protein